MHRYVTLLFAVLLAACGTPQPPAATVMPSAASASTASPQSPVVAIVQPTAISAGEGDVRAAVHAKMLVLQVDAHNTWADLGNGTLGLYIGTPRAPATLATTQLGTPLGFNAGYLGEIFFDSTGVAGAELKDVSGAGWSSEGTAFSATQQGTMLELTIPLALLGKLEAGDTLQLRVAASDGEHDLGLLPRQGAVEVIMPS